jgi:type I restriction enzyme S subunit
MANVSSSNGLEKRPKLRFPGFDEPYKQCRIGDIYAERSQRGASNMELLSVTMNDGVKPRSEIEGKDNSSEDKSNYKIVRKGDMVYNSMRMWQGANGISPCDGIVSPAYTVLMPTQEINNGYFAALFKSANMINEFRKNSQGMTSDTWNLKYPQIETIKIQIPSVSEQDKVSELFGVLDARIVAQAQLVESLKKYKRGLLSSVFSQNVSLFSTAAFYAFSELAVRRSEKYDPKCNAHAVCIELEHIEQETGRIIGSTCADYQNSIKTVCKPGDVMFGKLRPYLRKYAFVQKECVCSSEIWSLIPTDIVIPKYLFYLIQSEAFMKAANVSSGTKMPRAEWSTIAKSGYPIPSKDDQQATVDILETTDRIIVSHVASYDRLIEYKKGLLQRLFI